MVSLNMTIRNVLIDKGRRQAPMSFSDLFSSGESDEHDSDEDAEPAFPDPRGLSPEDVLAWKQLLHTVVDRLAPKRVGIAAMMMSGKSPDEIGAAYGLETKKVYVLTRHTRDLICKSCGT